MQKKLVDDIMCFSVGSVGGDIIIDTGVYTAVFWVGDNRDSNIDLRKQTLYLLQAMVYG